MHRTPLIFSKKYATVYPMKTVKEQLFSFLQSNPSVWHGGQLQRMDFKTRRGGLATGDSIKRRLNELAAEGRISVSPNERNEAMFSINEQNKKKIQTVNFIIKDGVRFARVSYV